MILNQQNRIDVTDHQRALLLLLSQHPEWTIGEIAQALDISSAAATKNINRLERKGCVQRGLDIMDRRRVKVSLTAVGRTIVTYASTARDR